MTYNTIYLSAALLSDISAQPLNPSLRVRVGRLRSRVRPYTDAYERRRADINPDDGAALDALGDTDAGELCIRLGSDDYTEIAAIVDNGCTDPMYTRITPDHLIDRREWIDVLADNIDII